MNTPQGVWKSENLSAAPSAKLESYSGFLLYLYIVINKSKYPKVHKVFEVWYWARLDKGDYLLNLDSDEEGAGFYDVDKDTQIGVYLAFFDYYLVYLRVKWNRKTISGLRWTYCTRNGARGVNKQCSERFSDRMTTFIAGIDRVSEILEKQL